MLKHSLFTMRSPIGLVEIERFAQSYKRTKHRISQIFSVLHRLSALGCGANGNRTSDTRIFSPLLYQLSYGTIVFIFADWGVPVFSDAKVGIIFELARGFSEFFSKMRKMEGQAGEQEARGARGARERESERENRRRKRGRPNQENKSIAGIINKWLRDNNIRIDAQL